MNLYHATRLVTDLEVATCKIPPDELKKIIDNDMANKFRKPLFENITVQETRDDKQGLTRLDYSVAIMTGDEYHKLMRELKELREVVDQGRRLFSGKE
ncbi:MULTISPECIES: hypothetical protein [unclassified Paenibacillus]|uniref:hypothetical protein n=1 Tax=unclassified Paenibacillus TaxID=185978 RepID=UPI00089BCB4B|nr:MULTISPECIES: hypothetical protein [unclassified Paenibacillus]OMC68600.1 hypothetical protein BK126_12290 [Paenibacillus sp. FSL H7-0326]SDW57588.1 hypothetical protein SAMN05518848_102238 [Paenibacillus sp. PDC88]